MKKGFLLQVLLAVWLPALLLLKLFEISGRNAQQASNDRHSRQMEEVLRRVADRGDLQRRFSALLDRVTAPPIRRGKLVRDLVRLQRENPGVIDLYLFSAGGKVLRLPGGPKRGGLPARRFLEATLNEQATISPSLLQAFGGNPRAPRLLGAAPGTLVDLMNGNRQTWGGWWALQGGKGRVAGHLVVFIHRGGIESERLLDRAVEETNRMVADQFLIGWQDPADPVRLRPSTATFPAGLHSRLSGQIYGQSRFTHEDRLGVSYRTESGELLFCLARPSTGVWQPETVASASATAPLTVLALAAGLSLVFWLMQTGWIPWPGGLRTRLGILILLAGGVPLLVLTFTALVDREDREQLLIDTLTQQQQTALARIDGDFFTEFDRLKDRYYRVLHSLDPQTFDRWSDGLQKLKGMAARENGLILRIFAVDLKGKLLFYDHGFGQGGEPSRTRDAMRVYGWNLLKSISGSQGAKSEDAGSAVLEMLAFDLSRGYKSAANDLQVQTVNNQILLTFIGPIFDQRKKMQAVLMAQHSSRLTQIRYVQRWMRRWGRPGLEEPRLLALPAVSAALWPVFPKKATGAHEGLARLRDLAAGTRLPCSDIMRINGREYLVSGLPGQNLDGYVLMLAQPIEILRRQTQQLNLRLAALSLLMLLLGAGMARLTSALLLKPVFDLSQGLDALRAGDFTKTVPVADVAELARMADRLNLIVDDLRDLQIARTVQEQLWPEKGLSGPGWSIDGISRSATDLGGDHYDWFLLPDGRLVVAVGDVAGHGIPSALVAAAVKVELALQARRETSPATILEGISRGLHEQMGRERTMSLWLGIFDSAKGILRYAAAGHPAALLMIGDEAREIGTVGYPLAARKQATYREGEVVLPTPSFLMIYTDGLVEARNGSGEPLGYPGLHRLAADRVGQDHSRLVQDILEAVTTWSGNSAPEDDQTLVMLRIGGRR